MKISTEQTEMKTREEFLASVDAYRVKTKQYFLLGFPLFFLSVIIPPLTLFIFEQMHLVLGEQAGPVVLIIWAYWVLALVGYPRWCCRKAAEKSGLVCANCSKVAKPSDVKLITASHNCPYCGKPFYQ